MRNWIILPVLFSFLILPAVADPVVINFTGTFDDTDLASILGDTSTFVLSITVDNHGSDLANQSWGSPDFVSATLSSGSYTAVYTIPSGLNLLIETDADGNIKTVRFLGLIQGIPGSDSLGGPRTPWFQTFDFVISSEEHQFEVLSDHTRDIFHDQALDGWQLQGFAVSEPVSLLLLASGLAAFDLIRRRT